MRRRLSIIASSGLVALALSGCAATAPQTDSKTPESSSASSKGSSSRTWVEVKRSHDEESPARRAAVAADSNDASGDGEEQANATLHALERPHSALSVLKTRGVTFMTDYLRSDAYRAASHECQAQAGEDEAKKAKCLDRARAQFAADALRLREEDDGSLWLVVYKRNGDELAEAHSSQVEVVGETSDSITLALKGPEKGKRALFRGVSRIVLNVPDSYSVQIDDSNFGHLVYDAKYDFGSR